MCDYEDEDPRVDEMIEEMHKYKCNNYQQYLRKKQLEVAEREYEQRLMRGPEWD